MLAESQTPMPNDAKQLVVPDNWSPEQETALLLDLCEAQMDAAMRDSDQSVDALVRAFTQVVEASQSMSELAKQMPAATDNAHGAELTRRVDAVSQQINDAIVAFQFYDKLTQRLGHVRHSLTTLAMFICNRSQTQQREYWLKLLTSLRRLYRTAEERAVFDLVAEGATADEVRASVNDSQQHPTATSVELF
jgi:hypothetical protein